MIASKQIEQFLYDKYHKHAQYICIYSEHSELLACARLVADSNHGFPVEQFCEIKHEFSRSDTFEVQRLCVKKNERAQNYSNAQYGIIAFLVKNVFEHCFVNNSVTSVLVDSFVSSSKSPIRTFMRLGFVRASDTFLDTELLEPCESVALLLNKQSMIDTYLDRKHDVPLYDYFLSGFAESHLGLSN